MQIHPAILSCPTLFHVDSGKFPARIARLSGSAPVTDFDSKLRVMERFAEEKLSGTTALIVPAESAEAMLDLCALSGLSTLVEITNPRGDLMTRRGVRDALNRVESAAREYGGRSGLIGFLIDCPGMQDVPRLASWQLRHNLRRLIETIHVTTRSKVGVAIVRHSAFHNLALDGEDFVFAALNDIGAAKVRSAMSSLRDAARGRPIIADLSSVSGGEPRAVAPDYGAAAVVTSVLELAPAHPPGAFSMRPVEDHAAI
jgi:hypothetical protein